MTLRQTNRLLLLCIPKSSKIPHLASFSVDVTKSKKVEAREPKSEKPISIERHRRTCTVCGHNKCAEIAADFVNWKSPALIAEEHGLADPASVYRHAHALGLIASAGGSTSHHSLQRRRGNSVRISSLTRKSDREASRSTWAVSAAGSLAAGAGNATDRGV